MPNTDRRPGDHDDYIEVWNDLVSTRDLTWSLLICGVTTALALLIATALSSSEFFWGLGGAVVGFVVCVVVFTPKRVVRIIDGSTDETAVTADETAGAA
ncbi:hypothetical protein [Corynebacterium sp.]|uniref:hypothetical protein n=1 Tax=Corynebacterium sp. TaxID=1720 RepID=UPI003B3A8C61